MSVLDDLLPAVTAESLRALVALAESDRPVEGLYWEFKSEWTPHHVAKSVAAFANASGGFVVFGATAVDGRLESLPGVPPDVEYPREIVNNIIGHLSPLPDWTPVVVPSPNVPNSSVVVIKVHESRRAPHVHCKSGKIYLRSPGGTSDPVKDRATLDRIIEKGLLGKQLVRDRIKSVAALVAPPKVGWQFSLISVPLPYGSAHLPTLLTQQGYLDAPALFRGQLLISANTAGVEQDAVLLRFGPTSFARILQDGTIHVWWDCDNELVPVKSVVQIVLDAVRTQRSFRSPVHEVMLSVELRQALGKRLTETFEHSFGRTSEQTIPDPWSWEAETSTLEEGLQRAVTSFQKRLWRSTGTLEFDAE